MIIRIKKIVTAILAIVTLCTSLHLFAMTTENKTVQNTSDNAKQQQKTLSLYEYLNRRYIRAQQEQEAQRLAEVEQMRTYDQAQALTITHGDNHKKKIKTHIKKRTLTAASKDGLCTICNKRFPKPSAMKRHLRTHTGEKPFQCSYCYRCFAEHGNCVRHERTHTSVKPFKCPEAGCTCAFGRSDHLTQHLAHVHNYAD